MSIESGLLRRRQACALCGAVGVETVLTLPATPPANEFVSVRGPQETFPLSLQLCPDCGHLQLAAVVNPLRLFANYVYVSGTSPVFVAHFEHLAQTLVEKLALRPNSYIVDIGSNDGTLLAALQSLGFGNVEGVEPAAEIARQAVAVGVRTVNGFFSRRLALELRASRGPADLITANNVFAHADDLDEIARGVRDLLSPEGEFVFEVSYLRDVVEKNLFDTIYHEHLSYHAVTPLVDFLKRCGLNLYDVQRLPTHGGSIRVFASRARKRPSDELQRVLREERRARLFDANTYREFASRIEALGRRLRDLIAAAKGAGQKLCGFGAPAKLTTLMYALDIDAADFEFIVDDSPWKQGLFTPGKQIPVLASNALYERKPDVCVVFAWNFYDSICAKHAEWSRAGGTFVNPLA